MSMFKRTINVALLLILFQVGLYAQSHPCGYSEGISEWLANFQEKRSNLPLSKSNQVIQVDLAIHLVGNDDGEGYASLNTLLESLCLLREDFENSGIEFVWDGKINYIPSTRYFDHNSFAIGSEMLQRFQVADKVNCFFVQNPAGNCGYANRTGVVVNKNCMGRSDHTWAHEIGHHFSLPHTFLGWESLDKFDYNMPAPKRVGGRDVELADGTNCKTAGDGFCDTPADYLNFRWSCTADKLSTQVQTDPNGKTFKADGTFIMSYSYDNCVTRFSTEQEEAMRFYIQDERPNLIRTTVENSTVFEKATPLSPVRGSILAGNTVRLEWTELAAVSGYVVQVSFVPNFAAAIYEEVTKEPFLEFSKANPGKRYYWRVKPLYPSNVCIPFSERSDFALEKLTNTREENAFVSPLWVSPNPVTGGQDIRLVVGAQKTEYGYLQIADARGIILETRDIRIQQGKNEYTLSTHNLAGGIYFVGLLMNGEAKYERFTLVR